MKRFWNRHAWIVFGLMYILAGLWFGHLYSKMPKAFYHATAKYEANLHHKADELMKELQAAFVAEQKEQNPSGIKKHGVPGGEVAFDLDEVEFFRPEVHGEYIHFSVRAPYKFRRTDGQQGPDRIGWFPVRVLATCLHFGSVHNVFHPVGPNSLHKYISIEEWVQKSQSYATPVPLGFLVATATPVTYDYRDEERVAISAPTIFGGNASLKKGEEGPPSCPSQSGPGAPIAQTARMAPAISPAVSAVVPEQQFVLPCLVDYNPEYGYQIKISSELSDKLESFAQTANGFPIQTADHLERMMYFSATTITTTGFGDIVPLTQQARRMVLLEILVGTILFGLFINALVQKVSASLRETRADS